MIVLESVEIEGFRGLKRFHLEFRPDKSVVVFGPNGTGKTSFFQALHFAVSGELPPIVPHLTDSNPVAYRHLQLDANTVASAKVQFSTNGAQHWIRRALDRNGAASLEESEPGAFALLNPDRLSQHCFLSRWKFSSMVEAADKDCWQRLTPFLGHLELARFRQGLNSIASMVRRDLRVSDCESLERRERSELLALEKQVASLLSKVGVEALSPAWIRSELRILVGESWHVPDDGPLDWPSLAQAVPGAKEVARESQRLRLLETEIQSCKLPRTTMQERANFSSAILLLTRIYDDPQVGHDLLHSDFLSRASETVAEFNVEACPLCGFGPPDWESVRAELHLRMQSLKQLQALRNTAIEALSAYSGRVTGVLRRMGEASQEVETPLRQALEAKFQVFRDLLDLALARLRLNPPNGLSETELGALEGARSAVVDAYRNRTQELQAEANTLRGRLRVLEESHSTARFQLLRELEQAVTSLDLSRKKLMRTAARRLHLDSIVKKLQDWHREVSDAEENLSAHLLESLQSRISEIFQELTGQNELRPTVEVETIRNVNQARVFIENFHGLGKVPARQYLSEAKRNSLGLAVYFAAILRASPKLRLLVMDDITHSADGEHRRALSNFIASQLKPRLQLVILTHDDVWQKRLAAVLDPCQSLQLLGWTLDGPTVKTGWKSHLQEARERLGRGDRAAGNELRQAIEEFVEKLCANRKMELPTIYGRSHDLAAKLDLLLGKIKESSRLGTGFIDASRPDLKLISNVRTLTNLASHRGSYEEWTMVELEDALKDFDDFIAVFSCQNQVSRGVCGRVFDGVTRDSGGGLPICGGCSQPIGLR